VHDFSLQTNLLEAVSIQPYRQRSLSSHPFQQFVCSPEEHLHEENLVVIPSESTCRDLIQACCVAFGPQASSLVCTYIHLLCSQPLELRVLRDGLVMKAELNVAAQAQPQVSSRCEGLMAIADVGFWGQVALDPS